MNKKTLVESALVCFAAVAAQGAGYALYEGTARGNVDAAGVTAKGGEPGALYFNAAALSGLKGTQIQIGTTAIAPQGQVETVSPYSGQKVTTDCDESIWLIPAAFVSQELSDSWTFGFGTFARYGLGAELNQDWPGRYGNYKAVIRAVDFNPNLVWQANDKLSISLGLTVRHFDIELAQKIDAAGAMGYRRYNDPAYSPYDVDQNLHGDDIGYGADIGVQYKPVESVTIGAAYHSRIKFKCEGDVDYTKPAAVAALAPMFFNDTRFSSVNTNPDEILLATAWDATDKLTLAIGLTCTMWSVYDDLKIDFATPEVFGRDTVQSEKKWNDAFRLSTSASYKLAQSLTGRVGYTFDQSPINASTVDYLVPADNRHLFSLGLGWDYSAAWTFDAGYFFEVVEDFDVNGRPAKGVFDGEFASGTAHALSLSATLRF